MPETPEQRVTVRRHTTRRAFTVGALRALTPAGTIEDLDAVRAAHDSKAGPALRGDHFEIYVQLARQERPDFFTRSLLVSRHAQAQRLNAHTLRALTPEGTLTDVYAARRAFARLYTLGGEAMTLLEAERPDLAPMAREWAAVLSETTYTPLAFDEHLTRTLSPIFTLMGAELPAAPPSTARNDERMDWIGGVTRRALLNDLYAPLLEVLLGWVEDRRARGSTYRFHGLMRVVRVAVLDVLGARDLMGLPAPENLGERTPELLERLLADAMAPPADSTLMETTTAWRRIARLCVDPMSDDTPSSLERTVEALEQSAPQPALTRLVVGLDLYGAGFTELGARVWRAGAG